ncbi:prolyl 3-hydroxylase 1-like [Plodia interpunctella]|uniref:prolyl 3-hydroxylase 1-like n=1 Tax=Plodia interpunctella TaxID=58824 RepID=UPI0023677F5D|nr:prolyl 3-hydroxylase 1-like [Plodia interpunctella]
MFTTTTLLLIFSFINLSVCENISLEEVYKKGIKSYSRKDWSDCVIQFEETITLYKLCKNIILNCRHKCKSQPHQNLVQDDFEDLKFYENVFFISNCIMVCQETEFSRVSLKIDISDYVLTKMINLEPYEYLQVCYYQTNQLKKAASAAATYLIFHPDDSIMRSNLQQFMRLAKLSPDEIVHLEAEQYTLLYDLAMKSYSKKDWLETVEHLENSVKKYLSSEESCRAECQKLPEQEWSSELMITLSNAIAALIHCQQKCQKRLKSVGYISGIDFLSEALNYLQICYYNLDKIQEAAEATASFLLLKPDDEVMLENKEIYSNFTEPEAFVVRSEIQYYLKRDNYEKELLELYVHKNPNLHSPKTNYI